MLSLWMQSTRHALLLARHWAARAGQGWEGGQWPDMLWGGVIGLQLALASYVFGEQCALIIDRYCVAGGAAETAPEPMLATCAPLRRSGPCAVPCTDGQLVPQTLQIDTNRCGSNPRPGVQCSGMYRCRLLLSSACAVPQRYLACCHAS